MVISGWATDRLCPASSKILFGLVHVNSNAFFALKNQPHLRGHRYVTVKQGGVNRIRVFFSVTRC